MLEFRIVNEFAAEPADFWRVLLDDTVQNEMYARAKMKRVEQGRQELDDRLVIRASYNVDWEMPAALRALLAGAPLGYTETLTFYRNCGHGEVEQQVHLPPLLASRARLGGKLTLESLRPRRVRRTFGGSVEFNVPLVGKTLEQKTVAAMQQSNDSAAEYLRTQLARRAA